MLKRIHDLDLETIADAVVRSTDVARARACGPSIQEVLDRSTRLDQRIDALRSYLGIAAMKTVDAPAKLQIEQPLVEAFVRTHHHPAAPRALGELPAGPRLLELANQRPDLQWDKLIVKALLWRAIQANRDHEVEASSPPWLMSWGAADGAAHALILFLTLEAFGSLEGSDPKADADRRELEQQTVDLARQMRNAIDRYDDPDVVAQREAYEREKAERIGASLASFYVKTGQRDGSEPIDQAIAKMLRYFAHRIDSEMPEVGNAPPIDQPLPTLDSGALVWLEVVSTSPARELALRIKSPNGKTTKSMLLLRGTKLRIITYLEASSRPRDLIAAIDELAASGI